MSRTERLLTLIQILRRHRRPVRGQQLADEMSVSLRTIYRDIQTLIAQGAPIEGESGVGFILKPGFMLPPLMFQEDEIEALILGARWVSQQPDAPLAQAAQDAIAKIVNVLPEKLKQQVELNALYPFVASKHVPEAIDLRILREAIRKEQKLRIFYQDKQGLESERVIWPLALGFFNQIRLLVAWCELRKGFRHFRTDRISAADLLKEGLPKKRSSLLKEWRVQEKVPEPSF
jgi:predicted DNA-binding transcriptional regulator YafY